MSSPVAIITGGSSGIGLALTKHLLAKNWRVAILDLQPPPADLTSDSSKVNHIKTDVSSWEANVAAFAAVWTWSSADDESQRRLDFVALNAGVGREDAQGIFVDKSAPAPTEPDMFSFKVLLFGPYYGLKLASWYMARNAVPGGKVVFTASTAGLRSAARIPMYSASKHGVVGLTRSSGALSKHYGVTVNAVCPSLVETQILPEDYFKAMDPKLLTPMSTVLRAYDELALFDGVADRESWVKSGPSGATVEANLQNLTYQVQAEEPSTGSDRGLRDFYKNVKVDTRKYIPKS